jgi:hypothetical protein
MQLVVDKELCRSCHSDRLLTYEPSIPPPLPRHRREATTDDLPQCCAFLTPMQMAL